MGALCRDKRQRPPRRLEIIVVRMKSIKLEQLPAVVIVGCCCSALVSLYTMKKFQAWKRKQELLEKIKRKQRERLNDFDNLRRIHPPNPEIMLITELSLDDLLERLQTRQLTAQKVLSAFIARAIQVTEDLNCITEFDPSALQVAETLDRMHYVKGPLHGLPICVKDDMDVNGLDTTIGFAKNLYRPSEKNSVPVQILLELGCIVFCKTNVPQALASINSDNPIFGTTYNALKKEASPGGSSGGAGCAVSAGATLVATGSDLAGSLRVPAHFHGLCSLRSTNGRLSCKGMQGKLNHIITVNAVPGFITKDAKSQVRVYRYFTEDSIQNKFDRTVVPLPWNELLFTTVRPLKIGYYTTLPIFPAFGDTPETVLNAKLALEGLNYELVEFSLPDTFDLSRCAFGLYWCDLGKNLLKEFEWEPLSKSGSEVVGHAVTPVWMRKLLAWIFSIKSLPMHSTRMKELLQIGLDYQNVNQFTECINHLKEVRNDVLARMESEGIDLLLGPVMPFPSIEERVANLFAMSVIYTFVWNVLDMPAGVVRFGTETGKLIEKSNTENDSFLEMVKNVLPTSIGLPINVQIIGKPFQEELVLRGLCDLENYYEKHIQKPKTTHATNITSSSPPTVISNGNKRNGILPSSATA